MCKINSTLKLLNVVYLINKNVKINCYNTVNFENCYYCDTNNETYDGYSDCPCRDDRECRFSTTTVDRAASDAEYFKKEILISKIIKSIKTNALPIKYGKSEGVIYFEFVKKGKNCQVSFHDPKNKFKNIKNFNGVWNQIPNKKIPFSFAA